MKYAIKHLFHISTPKQTVWDAITSVKGIDGWWATGTTGTATPGGTFQMHFGTMAGPEFKVSGSAGEGTISWECTASSFGWLGHVITFQLDENEGKTRVRFSHEGFKDPDDSMAASNFSWARYMESLRQLCQTGRGEAFGSEGYRK